MRTVAALVVAALLTGCGAAADNGSLQGASIPTTGGTGQTGTTGGFCSTHSCTDDFDSGNGYIVECNDGVWSHSGGIQGACSHHKGESANCADESGNTIQCMQSRDNHGTPQTGTNASLTEVPDVSGQSQDSAITAVHSAGFQVTTRTQDSPSVQAGNVISQDPAGGTQAPTGSTVTLVIATTPPNTTPPMATVPDVKGQQANAATNALKAAGFTVSQLTEDVTNPANDGIVLSQTPEGNSRAVKGLPVVINVGHFMPSGTTGSTTTTGP